LWVDKFNNPWSANRIRTVFADIIADEGGLELKFLQFRHVMIMFSRQYRDMTSKFFIDSLFDSQCTHAFRKANSYYGVSGHDARVGPGEKSLYALVSMVWHNQLGFDTDLQELKSAPESLKKIIKKRFIESLDEEVRLEDTLDSTEDKISSDSLDQSESLQSIAADTYADGLTETASTLGNHFFVTFAFPAALCSHTYLRL
jgi:hypothetical protein